MRNDTLPCVIAVDGLKRSGKTTVAKALISEMTSRGYRVGSVKTIHHDLTTLDSAGTDTRRHAEAGAEFVIALLDRETAYFEKRSERGSFQETAHLFRPGVQFVVWEGAAEQEARPLRVVCLGPKDELDRTLGIRGIPSGSVLAISGIAAASLGASVPRAHPPAFDVTDPAQRKVLVDLIIKRSGVEKK
jgi:molybdopterin-guanine dinucleotide biosynthesis protein MobB